MSCRSFLIADPGNGPLFRTPEQRQVSHVLVYDGEGPGADAREVANRLFQETDWTRVTHAWDLLTVRDRFIVAAGELNVVVRVEEHFLVAAASPSKPRSHPRKEPRWAGACAGFPCFAPTCWR